MKKVGWWFCTLAVVAVVGAVVEVVGMFFFAADPGELCCVVCVCVRERKRCVCVCVFVFV